MISRRFFVLSSLGTLLLNWPLEGLARKAKISPGADIPRGSARTMARQEWPPAISPDYVGIVERGYACFADDMGRIAVVDLKREDNPLVISELTGIGRKVLGLTFVPYKAFAIVQAEVGADTQFQLVTVSLSPPTDLSILSRVVLDNFSEPTSIAASSDTVAIGGLSSSGQSQVALYTFQKRKSSVDPAVSAVLGLSQLPLHMDLQERTLLALCGADKTDLTVIGVANARAPEKLKTIDLQGSFSAVARFKDTVLVGGSGTDKRSYARLITLRPEPAVARSVTLPAVTEVLDIAAQRGQFLILGNQADRQAVVPLVVAKNNQLSMSQPVLLPAGSRGAAPRARIAARDRDAYIASDWGGVQVLNVKKVGWEFTYSHTIPRLPASAIVLEGNRAVLASGDLKVYDLADLRRPSLLTVADIGTTIRSMVGIGRSVLCLTRDGVYLRPVDQPGRILHSMSINATALAYDRSCGKAYLAASNATGTTVTVLKATEDTLTVDTILQYPFAVRRMAASGGRLLLANLNDLYLYTGGTSEMLGKRNMPNLAVRDLLLTVNYVIATCVDENLRGYLLLLSTDKEDLALTGSTDLPVDGAGLALSAAKVAIVVGRGRNGKDLAALVGLMNPAQPKVMESFEVIDAASAVATREQTAVIVGRGLEIINMS